MFSFLLNWVALNSCVTSHSIVLDLEIIRCGFGGVDGVGCFACVVLTFHVDLETKVNN